MISDSLRRLRDALTACETTAPVFMRSLPLTLPKRANARGHWAKHAKTYANQRLAGYLALKATGEFYRKFSNPWPLVVRIVRVAPRALDDDGAVTAAKSLRDGIADALGVDDRDARVTYVVDQSKAKVPSVLVEIYAMKEAV